MDNPSKIQIGGSHYTSKTIQPWDAMEAWMSPDQFAGFLRGNAIKYLARCDDKGGLEDIKKARHYLDKLIELLDATLAHDQRRVLMTGEDHHG